MVLILGSACIRGHSFRGVDTGVGIGRRTEQQQAVTTITTPPWLRTEPSAGGMGFHRFFIGVSDGWGIVFIVFNWFLLLFFFYGGAQSGWWDTP